MKKVLLISIMVVSLIFLLTPNYHAKAQEITKQNGNMQITEINEANKEDELIIKTVKTQKQLTAALNNSSIDTIIIKPITATKLSIPVGNYKKNLLVYQAYTTLINDGIFEKLNIIVTNQYQVDKAVKTKNIDVINVKTSKKITLTFAKSSINTELIINAPNSIITNAARWKNVVINNMNNSTWTEKGSNNNIIVAGDTETIIVDKKATIKTLIINQPKTKDLIIKIKVDGKVKAVDVETKAEIILSGKNTNTLVNNISNKTIESIVIKVGNKELKVKPVMTVTPTPTEAPKDVATPTPTVEPDILNEHTVPDISLNPTMPIIPFIPTTPTVPTTPVEPTPTVPVTPTHTHNYVSEVTTAATCTENGVKTYTCLEDGDSYTEAIPATGHTPGEWIETLAVSYTTTGTRVQNCTVCGVTLSTETMPILPHTHNYTSEVTTAATESTTGVMTYTCTICGDTYIEVIPILDPVTPTEPAIYSVAIESTDGKTPSSVTGRDRLDLATEVFNKVNELRASLGLTRLTWDTTLDDYTQLRAAEVTQKFSHERPNLERGYQMNYAISSENIAVGYYSSDEVMNGWINSLSHYNAMVNLDYTSIAVGCFEEQILDINGNPTGDFYTGWVQFFSY